MKINVYNEQKELKISKLAVNKQIKEVLISEKIYCDEISIYFVNEKKIKELHKQFFNDPSSTDCISFPIDSPNKSNDYCFLGEIFVCTEVAIKYGEDNNINPYDEAALYVIHGILHLIGYNDISEKDKIIMREKEKKCMSLIKDNKLGLCSKHTKELLTKK